MNSEKELSSTKYDPLCQKMASICSFNARVYTVKTAYKNLSFSKLG